MSWLRHALLLAVCTLAVPAPAAAQTLPDPSEPAAAPAAPDPSLLSEDAQRHYWQTRYRKLLDDVDAARERADKADAAYSQTRSRLKARGEKKAENISEREAAHAALASAETALASFREKARRGGCQPGWLRDVDFERQDAVEDQPAEDLG